MIFIQENEFENGVCKMVANLSRPHCIKKQYDQSENTEVDQRP